MRFFKGKSEATVVTVEGKEGGWGEKFVVKGTAGTNLLGGEDLDNKLVDQILRGYRQQQKKVE